MEEAREYAFVMGMSGDNGSKLPVNVKVEVGAKAELKGEVPSDSLGRLVDALTDAIRPFTERRGLKADMIRLQREEVAIEIAQRAKRRIEFEGKEIKEVPTKILVRLLESSSLEDIDDEFMIETWSNMLSSAATESSVEPKFVGILSELNGRQAKLLQTLFFGDIDEYLGNDGKKYPDGNLSVVDTPLDGLRFDVFDYELQKLLKQASSETDCPIDRITHTLDTALNGPGLYLVYWQIVSSEHKSPTIEKRYNPENVFIGDLEILGSLQLVRDVWVHYSIQNYEFRIRYFQITDLGIRFLAVCSPVVKDKTDELIGQQWARRMLQQRDRKKS